MHKNNYEFTFTDLSYFKKNEEEKQKLINLPNFYDYKIYKAFNNEHIFNNP